MNTEEIEELAAQVVGKIYWAFDKEKYRTLFDKIGSKISNQKGNYAQAEVEMLQTMIDVMNE